jgi:N-methylhydantoinase A/acetophenone carboxylase
VLTVGIDLGGTFTDGYFDVDGRTFTRKAPTYRFDLTRSVVACLEMGADAVDMPLRRFLEQVDLLRIATTVGTNAVIEGTGSRVGLVVVEGNEDNLYAQDRPEHLYANFIAPDFVRGAAASPDADAVLETVRDLVSRGVRQIVLSGAGVSAARAWEREIRGVVHNRYPAHYLRSVPLQMGTDVAPSATDSVRTATAVVNAYLHREVAQLLHGAEQHLRNAGLDGPLLVVHANSGVARIGKTTAINTYSSGPAAGLSAAETIATICGDARVITADMGGTTVDLGVIVDGRANVETRPQLDGVELALPMLRTESIGCAGCSIVGVRDGYLTIGPESAGAVPGPAAFGLGGDRPTLTDADLLAGFLVGGKELGGELTLDRGRAHAAVAGLAEQLGTNPEGAAAATEAEAARIVGAALTAVMGRNGLEAADVTVYAFGGAGPTHLWAAARDAGIRRVRSFSFGSAFSALGCTVVDLRHRYEHAWDAGVPSEDELTAVAQELVERGFADVRAEQVETLGSRAELQLVDAAGNVLAAVASPVTEGTSPGRRLAAEVLAGLPAGSDPRGAVLELTARVPRGELSAPESASHRLDVESARDVWWDEEPVSTLVMRWSDLQPGVPVDGPVVIEDVDCTHAVGPGWRVTADELGTALWEAVDR